MESSKYIVVLLLSAIQLLLNAALIVPVALESMLIETLKIDITKYALLCSIYSWPAVILTILGAILVNRYLGIRNAVILFMFVLCIGQTGMALGAFIGMYWVMIAFRIVVGIGGVIVFSTTDVMTARWFKDRLTLIFAITGTFGRIGCSGGIYLNAYVYHLLSGYNEGHSRLGLTVLFSALYLVIGTVLAFILAVVDKQADNKINNSDKDSKDFAIREIFNFNTNFWLGITPCILFLCAYFPFADIAQVFIVSKYGLSIDYANTANLLIFLTPVFGVPAGLLIDWTGYNISWSLGGLLIACGSYIAYLFIDGKLQWIPFVANITLGLSYSCVNTALWSAPPFLVQDHQLVTAYAVLEAGLNLGFAVTGVITGPLIDHYGYFVLGLFFMSLLMTSVLITVTLIIRLANTNLPTVVNKPGWQRRLHSKTTYSKDKVELRNLQNVTYVPLTITDDSAISDDETL